MERDYAYRLACLLGVFSADWTLLSWTPAWAVLLGDPSARTCAERNMVRAVFAVGPRGLASWPVLQDGDALNPALVADLRTALVNYPRDRGLADLIDELRSECGVHPAVGRGCGRSARLGPQDHRASPGR
jgi:hypothetical protein